MWPLRGATTKAPEGTKWHLGPHSYVDWGLGRSPEAKFGVVEGLSEALRGSGGEVITNCGARL